MELIFADEGKQLDAKCSTLVLPALSIGNVGQLAVDLLISTFKAEKIGYLDDPNVLPCVGDNAYSPSPAGDLALPLEVYESPAHGLTFIQQRSPVAQGMMIQFAKNLSNFAAANGMKHVIVISGLDFIHGAKHVKVHYLSDSNMDGTDEYCGTLGWKKLQEEEDYYPSLPFAALFSGFKAKGLKVTCLLCYCSEGDNTPEAFHLAEATRKLLKLRSDGFQAIMEHGSLNDLSQFTFSLTNENHTPANSLRFVLNQDPRVSFCGYSIPHPSDPRVNIRVQTTGDPASKVLKDSCEHLTFMCQHVRSTFEQAVKGF